MASILFLSGTTPSTAVDALRFAGAARQAGHETGLILRGEAMLLLKAGVADGVPMPPLVAGRGSAFGSEYPHAGALLRALAERGIAIYVFRLPAERAAGLTEQDLADKNARFIILPEFANLVVQYDRVVSL